MTKRVKIKRWKTESDLLLVGFGVKEGIFVANFPLQDWGEDIYDEINKVLAAQSPSKKFVPFLDPMGSITHLTDWEGQLDWKVAYFFLNSAYPEAQAYFGGLSVPQNENPVRNGYCLRRGNLFYLARRYRRMSDTFAPMVKVSQVNGQFSVFRHPKLKSA